jgi:hypothetical protein
MKLYEMIFVTQRGERVQGPIFKGENMQEYTDVANSIDDMTLLRMRLNNFRVYIPKIALHSGHIEIRRVGWLRMILKCNFRYR